MSRYHTSSVIWSFSKSADNLGESCGTGMLYPNLLIPSWNQAEFVFCWESLRIIAGGLFFKTKHVGLSGRDMCSFFYFHCKSTSQVPILDSQCQKSETRWNSPLPPFPSIVQMFTFLKDLISLVVRFSWPLLLWCHFLLPSWLRHPPTIVTPKQVLYVVHHEVTLQRSQSDLMRSPWETEGNWERGYCNWTSETVKKKKECRNVDQDLHKQLVDMNSAGILPLK